MPFDGWGGGGGGVSAVSPRGQQVLISSGELTKESFYLVSLSVWFPFGVRISPEPPLDWSCLGVFSGSFCSGQ